MSYPRVNTIQVAGVGAAVNTAVTVKLPNGSTGTLPTDQSGTINPIGISSRWRIKSLFASFGTAAAPTTPVSLTVTDGVFTWIFDVTTPLLLPVLDVQCAGGAEVDITLAAATSNVGHLNLSVVSEG